MPELEEHFVKFLKHIEILSSTDPSKEEGQKLISLIFNIDKYKAYQNVSLQLFDQESLIQEEDHPVTSEEHQVQQVMLTAPAGPRVSLAQHNAVRASTIRTSVGMAFNDGFSSEVNIEELFMYLY